MNSTLDSLQSHFCFVGNLRKHQGWVLFIFIKSIRCINLLKTGAHKMKWRFLTLSDPLVDVTLIRIRDLDSDLSVREMEAVTEWLKSSAALHVMRDNTFHQMPILGALVLIANLILWSYVFRWSFGGDVKRPQRSVENDFGRYSQLWAHSGGYKYNYVVCVV